MFLEHRETLKKEITRTQKFSELKGKLYLIASGADPDPFNFGLPDQSNKNRPNHGKFTEIATKMFKVNTLQFNAQKLLAHK